MKILKTVRFKNAKGDKRMLKQLLKRISRRAEAVALIVCMVTTMAPSVVLADEMAEPDDGQEYACGHVHDSSCGYKTGGVKLST